MVKITGYPNYSGTVPESSAAHKLMSRMENAARQGFWLTVLDLLQEGPIIQKKRDNVLRSALECLGTEEMCLNFVRAARTQEHLLPHTDHAILKLAAERNYPALASEQISCGDIEEFVADMALEIAAANNPPILIRLFLESNICSQSGKNKAALKAAEIGAFDCMLEFLKTNSIAGVYVHPKKGFLDETYGPLSECIWTVLIREAGARGNWDIANAVAMYKPYAMSRDDLNYLAIAAAAAGQRNDLEEILSKGSLPNHHVREAYRLAAWYGHDDLLPLLAQHLQTEG